MSSPRQRRSLRRLVAAMVSSRNPRRTLAYIVGFPKPTDGPTLTAYRTPLAGPVGVHGVSGCDGERFFGDEAEGCFGGSGLDSVAGHFEATDHTGRLVRRGAFRHSYEHLRHDSQYTGTTEPNRAGRQNRRGSKVGTVQCGRLQVRLPQVGVL